ncbi:MAG TPA: DUF4192 domain-containing protein, partial [Pseudonocardia sp.]|nr:DUF4192 domain-containing protein [Pseudonocardia sp.]
VVHTADEAPVVWSRSSPDPRPMAQRDTPRPLPALPSGDQPAVRVRDPGDLIAAVPAVLGFHPRESLVLIATGGPTGRRVGLTLRVDLPPPEDAGAVCRHAAATLLSGEPRGAAVLVIGGSPGPQPPRRDVAAAALEALSGHGVEVHTLVWARSTAGAAPWACYESCGCRGSVPDPAASPALAGAVVAGKVVFTDRSELERLVAPADREALRRREKLLTGQVDAEITRPDPPGPEAAAQAWAVVEAAIAEAATGRLALDDARVIALARALALPQVRDAALGACTDSRAAAAEQVWAALARETPDPEVAEPAALLAASALARGDGALANVALERARRAWPDHRLTALLHSVAAVGIRPERFRECLAAGVAAGGPLPRSREPGAGAPGPAAGGSGSRRRRERRR